MKTIAPPSPTKTNSVPYGSALQKRKRLNWWALGIGLAIVMMLGCYAVALNAYWVGDDYNYVRPKDWDAVINFFNPVNRATWRPLNFLIWQADYALFGDQPLGWRLTRLAIHSLNIVSAGLLVRAITGRPKLALFAAALFAIHPSQTETVTWAGGQADISFAVAWLPALWMFVRWRQGASSKWWIGAAVLGFIAMLGKEAAVTLPIAALWIDLLFGRQWARWPGRRDRGWWRDWRLYPLLLRDHSMFITASAAYIGLRLYLFLTGQGRLMYGVEEQLGFFGRAIDVMIGYLALATGAWWVPQQVSAWPLALKLAILAGTVVGLVALVRWLGKLGRVGVFAIGWIGITLLLTLQAVANRWFYVPSLGVSLLVACIWVRLRETLLNRDTPTEVSRSKPAIWRQVVAGLPLLTLVWWGGLTVVHNELWRQSGEVARDLMAQVRALQPNPPRPATFYMANPPYSYKGVLLFNSGFGNAIHVTYQDWTSITSYNVAEAQAHVKAALDDPSKVGPNPIFLRYENGRMVEYPSLARLVPELVPPGEQP